MQKFAIDLKAALASHDETQLASLWSRAFDLGITGCRRVPTGVTLVTFHASLTEIGVLPQ